MDIPDTPAGRRLRWLIDHTGEGAASVEEITDQFEPWFLERVPLERIVGFLAQSAYLRDAPIVDVHAGSDQAVAVRFAVGDERLSLNVHVDNLKPHRITGLIVSTGPTRIEVLDETPAATGTLEDAVREKITPFAEGLTAGGIVVGAMRGGESIVVTFGVATRHGLYDLGSITKPFTGILLAEMVRRGDVSLDDHVSAFLPDEVTAPPGVTLLALATHSSGLPSIPPNFEPADMDNPWATFTRDVMYEALSSTNLEFEPGSKSSYSNFGFDLLGHALELAGGQSFAELLEERVCRPLGLAKTRVFTETLPHGYVQGYRRTGEPTPAWTSPLPGAGGASSTIDDLLAFAAANLDPASTPIAESLEAAQAPRIDDGERMHVCLGWHIIDHRDGSPIVWHNGGTGGFRSFIALHPASGTAVAALCNNGGSDPDAAVLSVLAALTR